MALAWRLIKITSSPIAMSFKTLVALARHIGAKLLRQWPCKPIGSTIFVFCVLNGLTLRLWQWGDSEGLQYEQPVISISMPSDSPAPYVALGKIKALYAMDDAHVIRASAEFAIGASGSPMFDYSGNLIAISTVKSPGHRAYFYNMPAKWVKALLLAPEVKLNAPHDLPFWDAPDEQRPFFMRVVLPYQNSKWAELKAVAQEWLIKEPTSAEALFYAGVAEENLGDLTKANTYFKRVLKLHPQHSATLIELGLMANTAGKTEEVARTHIALKALDSELDDEFTEALKPVATQQSAATQ